MIEIATIQLIEDMATRKVQIILFELEHCGVKIISMVYIHNSQRYTAVVGKQGDLRQQGCTCKYSYYTHTHHILL